ncbi:MAG: hypothetical protein ACOCZ8_04195 [Bacteroidota bacterium]
MTHHGQLLRLLLKQKRMSVDVASNELGISRATLYRKFEQNRLDPIFIKQVMDTFDVGEGFFQQHLPTLDATGPQSESYNNELDKLKIENEKLKQEVADKQDLVEALKTQISTLNKLVQHLEK